MDWYLVFQKEQEHWNHQCQHIIHLSSLLVHLWLTREDDNMVTTPYDRFSIPNFISQDFQHWSCSPYKFQKTRWASFNYCINLAWLSNLRFDYSKTFGGLSWLHVALATRPPMLSQEDLLLNVAKSTYSALIPKLCLWEHKSIKFLYLLYCPLQPSEK